MAFMDIEPRIIARPGTTKAHVWQLKQLGRYLHQQNKTQLGRYSGVNRDTIAAIAQAAYTGEIPGCSFETLVRVLEAADIGVKFVTVHADEERRQRYCDAAKSEQAWKRWNAENPQPGEPRTMPRPDYR